MIWKVLQSQLLKYRGYPKSFQIRERELVLDVLLAGLVKSSVMSVTMVVQIVPGFNWSVQVMAAAYVLPSSHSRHSPIPRRP